MATLDSVHKLLASSPMPLAASTIAELTGAEESHIQLVLAELARQGRVRRVNHRWISVAPPPRLVLPVAMLNIRR
ncbi:MAG TPA: hypothetical protein VM327_10115 [Candidatus Thermoplasmatota archaeon]|nr:hypothetical protein [Candidatus Thermoplasmatota archaeon]